METCFQMVLGKFEVDMMIKANALFGTALFILYNLVVICVLMSMFLTIIADNYSEIARNDDFILAEEDPDLYEYLKEKMIFLIPKAFLPKRFLNENKIKSTSYKYPSEIFPQKVNELLCHIHQVSFFFDSLIFLNFIKFYL